MPSFSAALQNWFSQRPAISLRAVSNEAKIAPAEISRVRAGKGITLDTLAKLLPAIERLSTRSEARALHVAYLNDETVPEYAKDIQIRAIADAASGTEDKDHISKAAERWELRARSEPEFARMFLTMDGYMHDPDSDAVDAEIEELTSHLDLDTDDEGADLEEARRKLAEKMRQVDQDEPSTTSENLPKAG